MIMRQSIKLVLLLAVPVCAAFLAPPSSRRHHNQARTKERISAAPALSMSTTATTSSSSTALPEGLTKTVSKEGSGMPVQRGDIATIKYACYVVSDDDDEDNSSNSSSSSNKPFARSAAQKMVVGEGTMIAGWEEAVRSMRVGERSLVRIAAGDAAAKFGYGAAGVPPVVPGRAALELDLELLDAQPAAANIDFDALADAADATPRTAADISAAYQARRAAAADEPELQGLDAFLAKAKNFYFYGLFEGETGERPPWFLRPSITFPLAFLVCGAAFYISFVSGAISERGAPSTDELDQIIMSSSSSNSAAAASVLTALVVAGSGSNVVF